MAGLSTHILDTSTGTPAAGIQIELFRVGDETALVSCTSNSDGRTDAPLIASGDLQVGLYELHFHAGSYFSSNTVVTDPPFLDVITIRFGISQTEQHYHVPLLLSPYGYSTYRGS